MAKKGQLSGRGQRTVVWIDDSPSERQWGKTAVERIDGLSCVTARGSDEARHLLEAGPVDAIVTDILRRNDNGTIADDDGREFILDYVRGRWPTMPVIFHTKNPPGTIAMDLYSQHLSKWTTPVMKEGELEFRLSKSVRLYEAFVNFRTWSQIETRLVAISTSLLTRMRDPNEIWNLTPTQFEQFVGELLERIGYKVLWIPGGQDHGIDIVASKPGEDFLIDVKRYAIGRPVSVEMVRRIYGVASAVGDVRPGRITHAGLITSSRFTSNALEFRNSLRVRPLLHDGEWLQRTIGESLSPIS